MNVVEQTTNELSILATRMVQHFNVLYGRHDDSTIFLTNADWLSSILLTYSDAHLDSMLEQLSLDYSLPEPIGSSDVREAVAILLVRKFHRKEVSC